MSTTELSTQISAIVGMGSPQTENLSIGNVRRHYKTDRPYKVSWEGKEYIVGAGSEDAAHIISERMEIERLAEGQDIRSLVYATLAQFVNNAQLLSSKIMIGLPVPVMQDKKLAKSILRPLRKWLLGQHHFFVDGREINVDVEDIKAIAQPVGTYFAWGLDQHGKWTRPKADLDVLVGICDNGFNTLDLFAVESGKVFGKYSGGEMAGIRRAAETLMREVKAQYGVELSRHKADQYLREKDPILSCWTGDENLASLTAQALESAAAQVGNILETSWGNGKQFRHLLFTGGGSALLKDHLLKRYPHGVFLPDPVLANAHGLARYGRRMFKDTKTVIGLDPGFGSFKAVALSDED